MCVYNLQHYPVNYKETCVVNLILVHISTAQSIINTKLKLNSSELYPLSVSFNDIIC
jgi:hypothetical protein